MSIYLKQNVLQLNEIIKSNSMKNIRGNNLNISSEDEGKDSMPQNIILKIGVSERKKNTNKKKMYNSVPKYKELNQKTPMKIDENLKYNLKSEDNKIKIYNINPININQSISKKETLNAFLSKKNIEKKESVIPASNKQQKKISKSVLITNISRDSKNIRTELSNKEIITSSVRLKEKETLEDDLINPTPKKQKDRVDQEIPLKQKSIGNKKIRNSALDKTKKSVNSANCNIISTTDRIDNISDIANNNYNQINPNFKQRLNQIKEEDIKNEEIIQIVVKERIFNTCSICDFTGLTKILYVADCHTHYLCEQCAKNYYEYMIDNNHKIFLCPYVKCRENFDIKKLEPILSDVYKNKINEIISDDSDLIESSERQNSDSNKTDVSKMEGVNENLQTNESNAKLKGYNKKHVFDVGITKNFLDYNENKGLFCSNCHEKTLFTKTNTYFSRCLNCSFKECKYCLKEYTPGHMKTKNENHCKVFFRRNNSPYNFKKGICLKILTQLFYMIVMYYFVYAGLFINLWIFFKKVTCLNGRKKSCVNIFKYSIVFILTFIIFSAFFPVIYICFPYFPLILALTDYY